MELRSAIAPRYDQIRPMRKAIITNTFPVYRDLVDRLVSVDRHPDIVAAHALATCAAYSYADEATLAMIMMRLGLEQNLCRKVHMGVDPMFICSTAYLVQSACGRVVILSYRGTELGNLINWLTDADVNQEKIELQFPGTLRKFLVHGGFYRNVRASRFEVVGALERALNGLEIITRLDADGNEVVAPVPNPLEALYVTGHSLGGAMAALMGVMLLTDPNYALLAEKLRAIYTFGQPMIGEPDFASACAEDPVLKRTLFRYVHEHDLVPSLPPSWAGPFAHFGTELRYLDEQWVPSERYTPQLESMVRAVIATGVDFVAHQVPALRKLHQMRMLRKLALLRYLRPSMYEHMPIHYVSALKPPHVTSEFGD